MYEYEQVPNSTLMHDSSAQPIVLPNIEQMVSQLMGSTVLHGISMQQWESLGQAALDLIAARLPVWQPVEPGTVIKAGIRVREDWDDHITEWTLGQDEDPYASRSRSSRYYIDPRTVPAEPEDPRVAVVVGYFLTSDENARDLLARLDAVRSDA